MDKQPKISVIGLGYVGLPLAVVLAEHYDVVGYDRSTARIAELRQGRDSTHEVSDDELRASRVRYSDDAGDMADTQLFIIAVPTPVDSSNKPELDAILDACAAIGPVLEPGAVVVLESTVYPGVTEDICGPALAAASGLSAGADFYLGYSPERMNPGDRDHNVRTITKVIAGQNAAVVELLRTVYGAVTGGNLFVAKDIRTAEAAKVIENTQRDINVAFINEVAMIFDKMGLSTTEVLAAARTKWNFLDFRPGLVGGHCIGVDPYYLALAAHSVGHRPDIIVAGRRTNEDMAIYLADRLIDKLDGTPSPRILVLGLTFKENVPDLRNTKVAELVQRLRAAGAEVVVCDPHADKATARGLFDIETVQSVDDLAGFDAVIGAVAHDQFRDIDAETWTRMIKPHAVIADFKGIWSTETLPDWAQHWRL